MRILIVEDDVALASFIRKGLEAEHYAVDLAADGEQGRAMAAGASLTFDDEDCSGFVLHIPQLAARPV